MKRFTGFWLRLGTGSRVLLGVLLGGMMSVDMGGPINKAAYVFGTASLASDEFQIMGGGHGRRHGATVGVGAGSIRLSG